VGKVLRIARYFVFFGARTVLFSPNVSEYPPRGKGGEDCMQRARELVPNGSVCTKRVAPILESGSRSDKRPWEEVELRLLHGLFANVACHVA